MLVHFHFSQVRAGDSCYRTTIAHTWIGENPNPTRKFAVQLVTTAMEVATGLPDWVNSSVTKNQGMEPGPVAKPITNRITIATAV